MLIKKFTIQNMQEILKYLKEIKLNENEIIQIEVLNPDLVDNAYAGKRVSFNGVDYLYRSFKAWNDLAEILFCKLMIPELQNKNTIKLTFKKLNTNESFHNQKDLENEKYGTKSDFSLINKSEEPSFIHSFTQALTNAKVQNRKNILNLGVNRADEFEVIQNMLNNDEFMDLNLVGVDFCPSAIEHAKKRFPKNAEFHVHDINKLDELNLTKADLLISIGTLQSSSLNFKLLFSSLIQNYLSKDSAIILGFPNCRWINGEMIFGAMAKNYSYSEMSVLHKDIYFCKKYLQQKKYRVTITGKNYIFLTATKINI